MAANVVGMLRGSNATKKWVSMLNVALSKLEMHSVFQKFWDIVNSEIYKVSKTTQKPIVYMDGNT